MSDWGDTGPSIRPSGAFQGVSVPGTRQAQETTAPPFSLRFTFEERARLEQEAGDQPLGAYIRGKLFEGQPTKPRKRRKRPVKDHQALGKILGELGKARLANNLNQLAKAVNTGSLPVTPDTEKAFRQALQARGYYLARGDRRGHVAVDYRGEVYAIARFVGVRTKQVRSRLGNANDLPTVEQAKTAISARMSNMLRQHVDELEKDRNAKSASLVFRRTELVQRQRAHGQRERLQTHRQDRDRDLELER